MSGKRAKRERRRKYDAAQRSDAIPGLNLRGEIVSYTPAELLILEAMRELARDQGSETHFTIGPDETLEDRVLRKLSEMGMAAE